MRRHLFLACATSTLAALAACATSDDEAASLGPVVDGGAVAVVVGEPSPNEVDAAARDASVPTASRCNDDGWCATELPDPNLTFIDVCPFDDRAFAVAESGTLGTKVLEWTEASQAWVYIDDDSQNTFGSGHYAGKMYAPSKNELYFTTSPGIVYRGTRADSSAPFTWESSHLPYDGPVYADRDPGRAWFVERPGSTVTRYATALGVTGSSASDVFAWYGNRIFRRTIGDGGAPEWVSEFVTEDPSSTTNESFYIFNASAASSDEVWFVGGHGPSTQTNGYKGCPTLFRRTPSGYSTVLDFTYATNACRTKAGTIQARWKIYYGDLAYDLAQQPTGWATAVTAVSPGTAVINIQNALEFYYVDTGANVAMRNFVTEMKAPAGFSAPSQINSVVRVDDRLWFSGHGMVFGSELGEDAWRESFGVGTYEWFEHAGTGFGALLVKTSVAMNESYLNEPLNQVRGTTANNLWAVGNRYALHKQTP